MLLSARLLASSAVRHAQADVPLQQRFLTAFATTAKSTQLPAEACHEPDAASQQHAVGTSSPLSQPLLQRRQALLLTSRELLPAPLAYQLSQRRAASGGPAWGGTKKYSQRRLVGWTPEQLYTVISRVEYYHEFVPWCQKSKIISIVPDKRLEAELEVGFQMLCEKYTSKVTLRRPSLVCSSVANSTLFHHLDNTWKMEPGPTPHSCWLSFDVDFAFTSSLYRHAADMFFSEVVKRMTGAFETRCGTLYGPSSFERAVQPKPASAQHK